MIPANLSSRLSKIFKFNTIELSLNNYCTLSCLGCPRVEQDSIRAKNVEYNSIVAFLEILNSDRVVLCGGHGEPTLYDHFHELLDSLSLNDGHSLIHISTNGETIFHHFRASAFSEKQKGKIIFQVAIDGHNNEIHTITRRNGNLALVIENVHKLHEFGFKVEIVSTRHLENEKYSQEIVDFVQRELGEDVHFRDTTHLNAVVKSPTVTSKRGDVSILYQNRDVQIRQGELYTPREDFLYIDFDGALYPCPSFIKHRTSLKPPVLDNGKKATESLKEFFDFRKTFCQCYQKEGDLRQCVVNCGSYRNFQYDYIEDIEAMK